MSKVKYAIPSHRRAETIGEKTLQMLADNGVHPEDVTIFLSDDEDAKAYLPLAKYGYTLVCPLHEQQPATMIQKFNKIHDYYPEGTRVVFVEDDITQLSAKGEGKNELNVFTGLPAMAKAMFDMCEHHGTKLWGISSNANPFFMKKDPHISYGFKFIVANLFGFISTRDPFLAISQHMKSDYERTLLYFTKFGGVCRSDGICAVTRNYKNAGGLQEIRDERATLEEQACHHLVSRFPHLVEINEKKSATSMYMELRFKTQKKGALVDWMALQTKIDKELSCLNSPATLDAQPKS